MLWQSKTPGLTEKVVELYPTMSSREIHDVTGFALSSVIRCARKNNLKHTEEAQARINAYIRRKRQEGMANRDYSKLSQKLAKTRRMESFRVMSGLKKETKYKVRITPKKVQQKMYYLYRKYGYFYDTVDNTTLYYDSETQRISNEQYYTDKYGIRIEPAEG